MKNKILIKSILIGLLILCLGLASFFILIDKKNVDIANATDYVPTDSSTLLVYDKTRNTVVKDSLPMPFTFLNGVYSLTGSVEIYDGSNDTLKPNYTNADITSLIFSQLVRFTNENLATAGCKYTLTNSSNLLLYSVGNGWIDTTLSVSRSVEFPVTADNAIPYVDFEIVLTRHPFYNNITKLAIYDYSVSAIPISLDIEVRNNVNSDVGKIPFTFNLNLMDYTLHRTGISGAKAGITVPTGYIDITSSIATFDTDVTCSAGISKNDRPTGDEYYSFPLDCPDPLYLTINFPQVAVYPVTFEYFDLKVGSKIELERKSTIVNVTEGTIAVPPIIPTFPHLSFAEWRHKTSGDETPHGLDNIDRPMTFHCYYTTASVDISNNLSDAVDNVPFNNINYIGTVSQYIDPYTISPPEHYTLKGVDTNLINSNVGSIVSYFLDLTCTDKPYIRYTYEVEQVAYTLTYPVMDLATPGVFGNITTTITKPYGTTITVDDVPKDNRNGTFIYTSMSPAYDPTVRAYTANWTAPDLIVSNNINDTTTHVAPTIEPYGSNNLWRYYYGSYNNGNAPSIVGATCISVDTNLLEGCYNHMQADNSPFVRYNYDENLITYKVYYNEIVDGIHFAKKTKTITKRYGTAITSADVPAFGLATITIRKSSNGLITSDTTFDPLHTEYMAFYSFPKISVVNPNGTNLNDNIVIGEDATNNYYLAFFSDIADFNANYATPGYRCIGYDTNLVDTGDHVADGRTNRLAIDLTLTEVPYFKYITVNDIKLHLLSTGDKTFNAEVSLSFPKDFTGAKLLSASGSQNLDDYANRACFAVPLNVFSAIMRTFLVNEGNPLDYRYDNSKIFVSSKFDYIKVDFLPSDNPDIYHDVRYFLFPKDMTKDITHLCHVVVTKPGMPMESPWDWIAGVFNGRTFDKISEWFTGTLNTPWVKWLLIGTAVLLLLPIIIPLVPLIVKFIVWLVMLPVKLIQLIVRKIRKD